MVSASGVSLSAPRLTYTQPNDWNGHQRKTIQSTLTPSRRAESRLQKDSKYIALCCSSEKHESCTSSGPLSTCIITMYGLLQRSLTMRPVTFEYSSEDLEIPPSNYRSHLKRAHSFHPVMNNHIQDPPSAERNSLGKDTGFPEPLSEGQSTCIRACSIIDIRIDRNTTLPHPDADTSPNASIEAPDVDLARTHTRRSFLGRHSSHQKASSFNPKDLEKSGLYDSIEYADGSREERHQGEESGKGSSDGSSLDGSYEKGGRRFSDGERKKGILAKLGFS